MTIEVGDETYTSGVLESEGRFINDWNPMLTTAPYRATPSSGAFAKVRRSEWVQHCRLWLGKLGRYSGSVTGLPPLTPPAALASAIIRFWADATGSETARYLP